MIPHCFAILPNPDDYRVLLGRSMGSMIIACIRNLYPTVSAIQNGQQPAGTLAGYVSCHTWFCDLE